jgi:hypothetical protein
MGALPPNPRDLARGCRPRLIFVRFAEAEDGDATLSLVRPRSRRSGCVPA